MNPRNRAAALERRVYLLECALQLIVDLRIRNGAVWGLDLVLRLPLGSDGSFGRFDEPCFLVVLLGDAPLHLCAATMKRMV